MKLRQKQNLNMSSQKWSTLNKVPEKADHKKNKEYKVLYTRMSLINTVLNVINQQTEESSNVKYLGVVIDSKLKFDEKQNLQNGLSNKSFQYT